MTVVAIPSQKALLICPYVSSGKYSVPAPRCSRALLHNLQLTSDCCLIFASHLATEKIPAIAIISRLLCLQGTRGSFKYLPQNALLSFCRIMKSAVHVPCALPCSALARTHDFKNFLSSIQVFCCHALIRFLISLLVCAVLYVITFAALFISSPECAHLSYCIPHAIIKCRTTILIS